MPVCRQDYTVLNARGQGVGGMFRISEEMASHGARPAWMGYIAVDDVDAMAAKVKREGGKMHREPFEIPGVSSAWVWRPIRRAPLSTLPRDCARTRRPRFPPVRPAASAGMS